MADPAELEVRLAAIAGRCVERAEEEVDEGSAKGAQRWLELANEALNALHLAQHSRLPDLSRRDEGDGEGAVPDAPDARVLLAAPDEPDRPPVA